MSFSLVPVLVVNEEQVILNKDAANCTAVFPLWVYGGRCCHSSKTGIMFE